MSELVECIKGMVERGWLYCSQTYDDITFVSVDNEKTIHFKTWSEVAEYVKEQA